MRTILVNKEFEDKYQEKILCLQDLEGYEPKEVKPLGKYGYRINTNHLYKIITEDNVYFVIDGKVTADVNKVLSSIKKEN